MNLALTLSLFVFFVMMTTFIISTLAAYLFHELGWLDLPWLHRKAVTESESSPFRFLIGIFIFCLILGQALTGFLSNRTLKPIRKVVEATEAVAKGNFDVKVSAKGIYELEVLTQSFNQMTLELASIETLKRDFINNFSHEFKTPIVSISGFAKLLKSGNLSDTERQEYLDIIISESERLSTLSTQILNLAKYETIEIVSEKTKFRLDEQIRKVLLLLEHKWEAKNLDLVLELEPVWYYGNEDYTQQIWLNLIDNAIKFSDENGRLGIRLISSQEELTVEISDSGCGMDQQTLSHIFEKFYQADTSHQKMGNGIGLAIVKRLIHLMDGTITVISEVGKGTSVLVHMKQ